VEYGMVGMAGQIEERLKQAEAANEAHRQLSG